MAAPSFPIDYDAIRRTLVQAVAQACNLALGQVMMLEQEVPNAPRPNRPYMGLMVTSASVKAGFDSLIAVQDAPGSPTGLFTYVGPRSMAVSFESYGRSHEEAYSLMALWQARLDQAPTQQLLDAQNMAVYRIGAVQDLSQLLNAAWEGRAQMDVTFGLTSQSVADVGAIDSVNVSGLVSIDATDVDVTLSVPS